MVREPSKDVLKYKSRKLSINRRNLPYVERKAYQSWADQRQRCYNPNNPAYKYYGAKGIKVLYSSQELIEWFRESIKTFTGKKWNVSRIDHSKDYSLDNIKLDDHTDNCIKEVFERYGGHPGRHFGRKIAITLPNGEERIFNTICEASTGCGRPKWWLKNYIYRGATPEGYSYRFID